MLKVFCITYVMDFSFSDFIMIFAYYGDVPLSNVILLFL